MDQEGDAGQANDAGQTDDAGQGATQSPSRRGRQEETTWRGLVLQLGRWVAPVITSIGAVVGFVAAAGGAIVWTRFEAAELPADQALAAMPRGELVATGAVALAAFGVLGMVAVAGVYLIDHGRSGPIRRTPGLSRGLLALVAVEAAVVTGLVAADKDAGWLRWGVCLEIIALLFLLSLSLARAGTVWAWEADEKGNDRRGERPPPDTWLKRLARACRRRLLGVRRRDPTALQPGVPDTSDRSGAKVNAATPPEPIKPVTVTVQVAIALVVILLGGALLMSEDDAPQFVGVASQAVDRVQHLAAKDQTGPAAVAALALVILLAGGDFARRWVARKPESSPPEPDETYVLHLTRKGGVAMIGLAAALVAIPALIMWEGWLAVSLATAAILGAGAWLTATASGRKFSWYGPVVFASVPFLGATVAITSNLTDPQLQPMALIRADDGTREALQGIYIAENDDRIYFANVASDRCTGEIMDDSGRMMWVDREDVVTVTLGPRQSVAHAGKKALDMFYALAPAAANPPVLRIARGKQRRGAQRRVQSPGDGGSQARRLEDPGPALRREYPTPAQLDVVRARVGDEVTLRGSGFGKTSDDRTLRVGGVPAEIVRRDTPPPDYDPERQDRVYHWNNWAIRFIVPKGGSTGPVTIECASVSAPPTLRVSRLLRARIALRMRSGGGRTMLLDGRASSAPDGGALTRRWKIGSEPPMRGTEIARQFPPRRRAYRVSLRVTNQGRRPDTAHATLWRLRIKDPRRAFLGGRNARVVNRIHTALQLRPGSELVVHSQLSEGATESTSVLTWLRDTFGVTASVVDPAVRNLADRRQLAALQLARRVRKTLRAQQWEPTGNRAVLRAFPPTCPVKLSRADDRQAARLDIFVVSPGTRPVPPNDCEPTHVKVSGAGAGRQGSASDENGDDGQ